MTSIIFQFDKHHNALSKFEVTFDKEVQHIIRILKIKIV
jgi:hypothetical protein